MSTNDDIVSCFDRGVDEYFKVCHDWRGHEKTHQSWLTTILARYIEPMSRIVAEYDIPGKDIREGIPKHILERWDKKGRKMREGKKRIGTANFDFCIAREHNIDARKFWTRTGHKARGNEDTTESTFQSLQKLRVIAEMKVNAQDTLSQTSLEDDLWKMCGAMKLLHRCNATEFPACFLVVFDPKRKANVAEALSEVLSYWPDTAEPPTIKQTSK